MTPQWGVLFRSPKQIGGSSIGKAKNKISKKQNWKLESNLNIDYKFLFCFSFYFSPSLFSLLSFSSLSFFSLAIADGYLKHKSSKKSSVAGGADGGEKCNESDEINMSNDNNSNNNNHNCNSNNNNSSSSSSNYKNNNNSSNFIVKKIRIELKRIQIMYSRNETKWNETKRNDLTVNTRHQQQQNRNKYKYKQQRSAQLRRRQQEQQKRNNCRDCYYCHWLIKKQQMQQQPKSGERQSTTLHPLLSPLSSCLPVCLFRTFKWTMKRSIMEK